MQRNEWKACFQLQSANPRDAHAQLTIGTQFLGQTAMHRGLAQTLSWVRKARRLQSQVLLEHWTKQDLATNASALELASDCCMQLAGTIEHARFETGTIGRLHPPIQLNPEWQSLCCLRFPLQQTQQFPPKPGFPRRNLREQHRAGDSSNSQSGSPT